MLQNAYFLAEIGADTAENAQHFAKKCWPILEIEPPSRLGRRGDLHGQGQAREAAALGHRRAGRLDGFRTFGEGLTKMCQKFIKICRAGSISA